MRQAVDVCTQQTNDRARRAGEPSNLLLTAVEINKHTHTYKPMKRVKLCRLLWEEQTQVAKAFASYALTMGCRAFGDRGLPQVYDDRDFHGDFPIGDAFPLETDERGESRDGVESPAGDGESLDTDEVVPDENDLT